MTPEGESTLEKAVGRWDTTAAERVANPIQGWMDSPLVLEQCILPKLGGGPGRHWLSALVDRHRIARDGHWLSLGCGSAGTEIAASGWGLFASMLAIDASPASLQIAGDAAAHQGVRNIRFERADLDRIELPRARFDLVLMNMSLHHVRELGHILAEIRGALRPGGWFVANEFVGPRQFQFSDLQLSIVRELLASLPDRCRIDSTTGRVKTEYVRMPVEHWNVADPSEAIRSDRIVPEIEKQFRVVERLDYGGTILNLLFEHIVHNFDPGDERDRALIALLGRVEDLLIRNGVLRSDFTLMIMRGRRGLWPGSRSRPR